MVLYLNLIVKKMKSQNEQPKPSNPISNLDPVLKTSLNVATSAFIITNMISLFKLPIEKMLQQHTLGQKNIFDLHTMRSLGLLVGMSTYVRASMPRSCYIIYSKNNTQNLKLKELEVECVEPIEPSQEPTNEKVLLKNNLKTIQPYLTVPLFAAGETLFTHTPEQLTVLRQQNVEFDNKKLYNYFAMTKSGLGLRYTSSLMNLMCLTHIQHSYAKMIFKKSSDSISANLISGALSGITAAFIGHPLKQLSLQVSISARSDDKKSFLIYEKTSTICKKIVAELKQQTPKEIIKDALPKLFLRGTQGAMIFGITTVMNKLLGDNPAEKAYDSVQNYVVSNK